MIVKNEEKYLRKCLEALKPVLDAVDSELIIADTGSYDNTVNIAKQYTDNVFHFEWCNDYSKARNYTLDRSQGEWFMFVDADEILQNPSEFIYFFNSGEYKKYNNASIIIRNLNSENNINSFEDFCPCRLIKKTPDTIFINPIHECFSNPGENEKSINAVFLHYGYIPKRSCTKKMKKYIDYIIKYLSENPNDARLLKSLADAYDISSLSYHSTKDIKNSLLYTDQSDMYYNILFFKLIQSYEIAKDYYNIIKNSDRYFSFFKSTEIINIYVTLLHTYNNIRNYKLYHDTFFSYENLYHHISVNGFPSDLNGHITILSDENTYHKCSFMMAYSDVCMNNINLAEKYLNDVYKKSYEDIDCNILLRINVLLYSLKPSRQNIMNMLKYIYNHRKYNLLHHFIILSLFNKNTKYKNEIIEIIKIISEFNPENNNKINSFIRLYKLIYLDCTDHEAAKNYLQNTYASLLNMPDIVLYYILKYHISITDEVKKNICSPNVNIYFYMPSDCFDVLTNAILSSDDNLIKMCLIERIFAYSDYYEENISNLLDIYYNCVCEYIKHTLNPDILSDTDNLFLLENNIMRFRASYKLLYEAYKVNDTDKVHLLKNIINGIGNILFRYVDKYFN